jgi:hypothetical protein
MPYFVRERRCLCVVRVACDEWRLQLNARGAWHVAMAALPRESGHCFQLLNCQHCCLELAPISPCTICDARLRRLGCPAMEYHTVAEPSAEAGDTS